MIKQTARFGKISYRHEDILEFPQGLVGFPSLTSFVMIEHAPNSAFRWLQSLDQPETSFLVVDPELFFTNYAPEISQEEGATIGLMADTPRLLLSTVNIPAGRPRDMSLNLVGPIVVNLENRQAKQVVLEDEAYTIKHRVFPTADLEVQKVAA